MLNGQKRIFDILETTSAFIVCIFCLLIFVIRKNFSIFAGRKQVIESITSCTFECED